MNWPGQMVVWALEGPRSMLAHAVIFLGALSVSVALAAVRGTEWGWGLVILILIELFWGWTRRTQLNYFKDLSQTWNGLTCPKCGYSRRGLASDVCPECGVNAQEYVERARRQASGEDPLE